MTERALIDAGVTPRDAAVAVLGYAYLEDSDDTRNSPSACLVDRLNRIVRRVVVHDPWVEGYGGDVLEIVAGCDAVILAVAHSAYRELNLSALARRMRHRVLIDGRAVFSARAAASAGLAYVGVGRVR
jgi:UDP-N-acetyl-D-mannosaminuronic acid dehydrogenase